jgi:hypothetical protein
MFACNSAVGFMCDLEDIGDVSGVKANAMSGASYSVNREVGDNEAGNRN